MNTIRAGVVLALLTAFGGARLGAEASCDEVSGLYRDIGKELITIRKDNPALQSTVYSLLDQVGKLYRAANTALQEKERSVQIAHEDREATFLLRGENATLKAELGKLHGDLQAKNVEVVKAQQQMSVLGREQEELRRKAGAGEAQRAEFESRVKALESLKPGAQAEVPPQQTPAQASLEGDRAREALEEFAHEVEPTAA